MELRKWTDALQKWLKAKDINGSSILRSEASRGPRECHTRTARHFLRCWLRFLSNKMGNKWIFSLKVWRLSLSCSLLIENWVFPLPYIHSIFEFHILYFLNKVRNFILVLKILHGYTVQKTLILNCYIEPICLYSNFHMTLQWFYRVLLVIIVSNYSYIAQSVIFNLLNCPMC